MRPSAGGSRITCPPGGAPGGGAACPATTAALMAPAGWASSEPREGTSSGRRPTASRMPTLGRASVSVRYRTMCVTTLACPVAAVLVHLEEDARLRARCLGRNWAVAGACGWFWWFCPAWRVWKVHDGPGAPSVVAGEPWTVRGRHLDWREGPVAGHARCRRERACQFPD